MSSIFISYRRSDSAEVVDRIESTLKAVFPGAHVSRDTGGIKPGENYIKVLQHHVEQDVVFLTVIGPHWLGPLQDSPRRRIDDPEDIVRHEAEWRLRNWRSDMIPILVKGGPM